MHFVCHGEGKVASDARCWLKKKMLLSKSKQKVEDKHRLFQERWTKRNTECKHGHGFVSVLP